MSVPVDVTALHAELARFGDVAFLVTARRPRSALR